MLRASLKKLPEEAILLTVLSRMPLFAKAFSLHIFWFTKPLVTDNVKTAHRCGNDLTFYLMEQVYAMKPKLAALEAKTKKMELDLAVQQQQMETLQNREFMPEVQVVSDYSF